MKQKQKQGTRSTINGMIINNVALDKNGVPQLSDSMGFLTIGDSGSVKDRTKKDKK